MAPINPTWAGLPCVVAGSGPSLTLEVADLIARSGWRVIAVNDAYKRLPGAQILYSGDAPWWLSHNGARDFGGERWTCVDDDSLRVLADRYGLRAVDSADDPGFSNDPRRIHLGHWPHSGFQATNLALLLGARRVVLIGFDLRRVDGRSHYFGEHPSGLRRRDDQYHLFLGAYPPDSRIVNATPGSALKVYPFANIAQVLEQ